MTQGDGQDTVAGLENGEVTNRVVASSHRDASLDILKGALVVVMVWYHAMNIFSTADPTAYSYVQFVSGSFILVSGYVLGRFQDAVFSKSPCDVSRRLIIRGVKLVILFTILNSMILITGFGNSTKEVPNFDRLGAVLVDIFVVGVAGAASFKILLPIGYVLISGPVFLWLGQRSRYTFVAAILLTQFIDVVLNDSVNMYFYTLGFIGLLGGQVSNKYNIFHIFKNAPAAIAMIVLVEVVMKYAVTHLLLYAVCTFLLVQALYDLCSAINIGGRLAQASMLLGRYSLICYIGQIIFMQSLSKALSGRRWALSWEIIVIACLTVLVLLALCESLKFLQRRYGFVAKAYDLVFL